MSESSAPASAAPETTTSEGGFLKWVLIAVGGLVAAIVGFFVLALVLVALNPLGAADLIRYIRDVLITVFCLQGIVIVVAFGLLLVQIGRFVNLLRNETKPVTDQARETLTTVRTSSVFVSKTVAEPLIAARSWFSGLVMFLKVLLSLRALRSLMKKPEKPDVEA